MIRLLNARTFTCMLKDERFTGGDFKPRLFQIPSSIRWAFCYWCFQIRDISNLRTCHAKDMREKGICKGL